MAQLLISKPGTMPSYRPLGGERLVVGRDPECQVHLDDPAVSKQHLAIFTLGNDDILEDLGSTNGTMVNGEVVQRHILQDHDVVQLGPYRLEYLNQRAQKDMDVDRTMIAGQEMLSAALAGSYASRSEAPKVNTTRDSGLSVQPAALHGVEGREAGWHIDLDKIVTPLARADGVTPAAILRRPHGYMVMRVSRQAVVRVNGENIGEAWKLLESDDLIEVGKDRYSFYLK